MYEMLVGFPPFYSDDPMTTCRKVTNPLLLPSQVLHFLSDSNVESYIFSIHLCTQIVNWRNYLKFPEEVRLSPEAKDLICRLLCNVEQRLGTKGADEIKVLCALFSSEIRSSLILIRSLKNERFALFSYIGSPLVQRYGMGKVVSDEGCLYSSSQ